MTINVVFNSWCYENSSIKQGLSTSNWWIQVAQEYVIENGESQKDLLLWMTIGLLFAEVVCHWEESRSNLLVKTQRVGTLRIILDDKFDSAGIFKPEPGLITCWKVISKDCVQCPLCWISDLILSCVSSFWSYFIDCVGRYVSIFFSMLHNTIAHLLAQKGGLSMKISLCVGFFISTASSNLPFLTIKSVYLCNNRTQIWLRLLQHFFILHVDCCLDVSQKSDFGCLLLNIRFVNCCKGIWPRSLFVDTFASKSINYIH